jgi:hypothetical protein
MYELNINLTNKDCHSFPILIDLSFDGTGRLCTKKQIHHKSHVN